MVFKPEYPAPVTIVEIVSDADIHTERYRQDMGTYRQEKSGDLSHGSEQLCFTLPPERHELVILSETQRDPCS